MYYDDDNRRERMEREREFRQTKSFLESRGYKVDQYGNVTPKSGSGPVGYIDSNGEYHSI